jgi:cell division protease FtsH
MSTRVGPMAWASSGQVFLGEDLIHTRDYSDETARVIDEETERILRVQEERCRETLRQRRKGLDLVARALLEHETIDGAEVSRLIRVAASGDALGGGGDDALGGGGDDGPVDAPVGSAPVDGGASGNGDVHVPNHSAGATRPPHPPAPPT